jgi:phosphatidate cytidylyltransferase
MNNPAGGTVFHHFPAYLTAYFLFTWIYDTGAYLVGKNFGKHKFFERISPKKTWEGTIGGTIVVIAATVGFYFITEGILFIHLLALTGLVILFGTFGDLAESLFKRSLNLKDSGNILPGHGGILDRFDTIFVSAPFVFLYFVFQIILYNK